MIAKQFGLLQECTHAFSSMVCCIDLFRMFNGLGPSAPAGDLS